jgi:transcriptional regulator with XRE-family HTH domain
MTAEIIHTDEQETYGEKVAAEVRAVAARKRVTGQRLAHAVGMTPMSMSRRMTGHQPFDIDELAAVATALGVRVEDLLPHLDSNQKPTDLQHDDNVTDINEYREMKKVAA